MAHVDDTSTVKPLTAWTMNELLARCPEAAEVLAQHGVNPLTRCHVAARQHMTLKQVLGKVCPVDDVAATSSDLERLREQG